MEHGCRWGAQARARGDPRRAAAHDVRGRRRGPPRPGQVVPRRAAAPVEHRAAVAHGRRAALARPRDLRRPVGPGCRPGCPLQCRGARARGHGRARHPRSAPASRLRRPLRGARRGVPRTGRAASGRRRPGRRRRRGARSRRDHGGRVGAAADHRGGVDQPGVELPPRPPGAHPRLERGRTAPAAGLDLVGGPGAPGRAVVPRSRTAAEPQIPHCHGRRPQGCPHHGARIRGSRRSCARLPPADHDARGVLRPAGGHRGGREADPLPRSCWRDTARHRTRGSRS